jgi:hypothetical protein
MKSALKQIGLILFFCTWFLMLFSSTALAYIDPAATSYIVQIISGVVIASGVVIGVFWKKIKLFFQKKKLKIIGKSIEKKANH